MHWLGWSREAINSSVMIILLTWKPHEMRKRLGGVEVKTHHGMNSCGVKLKEICQHWLRRRDVINKLNMQQQQSSKHTVLLWCIL